MLDSVKYRGGKGQTFLFHRNILVKHFASVSRDGMYRRTDMREGVVDFLVAASRIFRWVLQEYTTSSTQHAEKHAPTSASHLCCTIFISLIKWKGTLCVDAVVCAAPPGCRWAHCSSLHKERNAFFFIVRILRLFRRNHFDWKHPCPSDFFQMAACHTKHISSS